MEYTKKDMKKSFNAGKKCAIQHPDDSSYDKIHFDRVIKNTDDNMRATNFDSWKNKVQYCVCKKHKEYLPDKNICGKCGLTKPAKSGFK